MGNSSVMKLTSLNPDPTLRLSTVEKQRGAAPDVRQKCGFPLVTTFDGLPRRIVVLTKYQRAALRRAQSCEGGNLGRRANHKS